MNDVAVAGRSRAISVLDPAKLLHWRREVRMLTQLQLAEAAGLSRGEISHLETGKRKPMAPTLYRLCTALECEPGDLLAGGAALRAQGYSSEHAAEVDRRWLEENHRGTDNGSAGSDLHSGADLAAAVGEVVPNS